MSYNTVNRKWGERIRDQSGNWHKPFRNHCQASPAPETTANQGRQRGGSSNSARGGQSGLHLGTLLHACLTHTQTHRHTRRHMHMHEHRYAQLYTCRRSCGHTPCFSPGTLSFRTTELLGQRFPSDPGPPGADPSSAIPPPHRLYWQPAAQPSNSVSKTLRPLEGCKFKQSSSVPLASPQVSARPSCGCQAPAWGRPWQPG